MNNQCPRCGKQMVQKPPQTIYLTYPAPDKPLSKEKAKKLGLKYEN